MADATSENNSNNSNNARKTPKASKSPTRSRRNTTASRSPSPASLSRSRSRSNEILEKLDDSDQEVNDSWGEVVNGLERLDGLKRKGDELINAVNEYQERVAKDKNGLTSPIADKLSRLYKESIAKCAEEQKCVTTTLKELGGLIAKKKAKESVIAEPDKAPSEHSKKKKRKVQEEKVGSVILKKPKSAAKISSDSQILQKGQAVAALTNMMETEATQEWILARVLHYNADKNKYQVQDDVEDDEGVKAQYLLSRRQVLPLPPAAVATGTASGWPELRVGSEVLALYPGTSCFYKANVIHSPSEVKFTYPLPTYIVTFEDDAGQELPVDAQMVIESPKDRNKR